MKKIIFSSFILAACAYPVFADHSDEGTASQVSGGCHVERSLAIGARGEDVMCLQKALIEKGLLEHDLATGYFGQLTKEAVTKWQEHEGVPNTGFFGELSRAKFSAAHAMEEHKDEAMVMEHHEKVELAGTGVVAPTINIQVMKDAKDGWNVQVATTNFVFAPEHVNAAHMAGEGHAHIYVDGKKLARMYGNWFHVPMSAADKTKSAHEIKVTLNANTHADYAVNGVVIADTEIVN